MLLEGWKKEGKHAKLRLKQIRRWILVRRATNFEQMSDLPKWMPARLAESFDIFGLSVDKHLIARDETNKLLLRTHDNHAIECVLIQEENRRTACISTQVGCAMGCVFCASGLNGLDRNLDVNEIVEQLVLLRNLMPSEERLTHIVVMGIGEPLANLDNLLQALKIAGDKESLGIGARHVTISTVGLPAKIRELAESGKQYHLAVSLHAPNDALRTEIVPTNEKIGMHEILAAADDFYAKTGRQVTYEYVVLGRLNDQLTHAEQLVKLLRGRKAHVNLIPWNDVQGLPYRRPDPEDQRRFIDELKNAGISVKVRKRKGADIDAACGQLRREADSL